MNQILIAIAMIFLAAPAFADTRTVPADVFKINMTGPTVSIDAPSVASPYSLHYGANQGAANTCLLNDGSGNLSWLVAGSANAATTLVERDGSGNFTANQGTFADAVLSGSSSGSTTLQASAVASGTLTFPALTDVLISRQSTDQGANRLKNKDLSASSVAFVDSTDTSKVVKVDDSGATTASSMTLAGIQTVNRVLTLPDATDTLVAQATTDTLTNKSMSGSSNTFTFIPLSTAVSGVLPHANMEGPASTSVSGYLSSTDWTTFNGKQATISVAAPITLSTATVGITQSGSATNGYLSSIDWTAFNGKLASPMTTAGDLIYENATPAATRLAAGTSVQLLHSGSPPSWSAVSLTADVSGTLPIANGGTNGVTANAGFNNLSPMSAAGDVIYGGTSGAGTRLAPGSSTQVLHSGTTPAWGAVSLTADVSGTLPVGSGGTNVTSVTTTPTATAFAGWDANKNISANAVIEGYATTATAGSSTTIDVSSKQQQYFTGTSTQTLVLPVVSTLVLGQTYYVVNNSTGAVTVQSSGANTVQVMGAASAATFTVISTSGTGAGSWNVEYSAQSAGTVTSVAFSSSGGIFGVSGSPITTSGTISESVTGTSGGIPYFNSTSQLSSSAALTSNGVVLGGGAGSTPTSTTACTTANTVLRAGSPPSCGALVAADLPVSDSTSKIRVYLGNNQTISNGVTARVAFDTATFDTNTEVDITTNKGRLTAKTAGYYFVCSKILITTVLTNAVADVFELTKNSTRSGFITGSDKVTTGNTWWNVCDFFNMNGSTDFIEANFNNQEAGSITVSSNANDPGSSYLIAMRVF